MGQMTTPWEIILMASASLPAAAHQSLSKPRRAMDGSALGGSTFGDAQGFALEPLSRCVFGNTLDGLRRKLKI